MFDDLSKMNVCLWKNQHQARNVCYSRLIQTQHFKVNFLSKTKAVVQKKLDSGVEIINVLQQLSAHLNISNGNKRINQSFPSFLCHDNLFLFQRFSCIVSFFQWQDVRSENKRLRLAIDYSLGHFVSKISHRRIYASISSMVIAWISSNFRFGEYPICLFLSKKDLILILSNLLGKDLWKN